MQRPLAALALSITLALAACGGDEATPSATPSATPGASPTPTVTPAATITPTGEQLSYIGPDGEIRLVNADGAGDHVFSDAPCGDPGEQVQHFSMAWSADGARLGFICAPPDSSSQTLVVLNSAAREIARVRDVSRFRWSPDSTRLAYQRSAEPDVGLLDPGTGAERTLRHDAVLMEWVGPGSMLLGLEPVFGDVGTAFKAHLVALATGESTAFSELDNARTLWVSPDGARMIVQADQRDPNGSAPGMAVYDFAQDLAVVLVGGYIGYPSDFVPHEQLAFSRDGASIYWVNAVGVPAPVWTATLDEAVAERLGEVGSLFVAVSPSGRIAAIEPPQEAAVGTVAIHDLAAGTRAEAGRGSGPFAWREFIP